MSFFTQAKKLHSAGRLLISSKERRYKGLPWYACARWLEHKDAIKARVARRVHRATTRRLEREEAKKRGVPVTYSIA